MVMLVMMMKEKPGHVDNNEEAADDPLLVPILIRTLREMGSLQFV